ncbi:hypothetical protein [Saccharothrix sp. HUAS TT1]|uniref:hypothetical protein n=1 Tax=unclassified Saccharothrix TaxID=2593673 RepID=UPI00345B6537
MSTQDCWNGYCILSDCDGEHHGDHTGRSWWQPEGYRYVPGDYGMFGRQLPVWDYHHNDAGELCLHWQHEAPEGMERCPAGCTDEDAVNPDPDRLKIKQHRWRRKAGRAAGQRYLCCGEYTP